MSDHELVHVLLPVPRSYEVATNDDFDAIPWFTEKDAAEALQRMHAWASTADPLMRLVWDLLDADQRLNLARVCLELRPR